MNQDLFLGQVSVRSAFDRDSQRLTGVSRARIVSGSSHRWFGSRCRAEVANENQGLCTSSRVSMEFSEIDDVNAGRCRFQDHEESLKKVMIPVRMTFQSVVECCHPASDDSSNTYMVWKRDTHCRYSMRSLCQEHDLLELGPLVKRLLKETFLEEAKILSPRSSSDWHSPSKRHQTTYLLQRRTTGKKMFNYAGRISENLESYLAEIILGLQFLRQHDIRDCDLNPDKILLDARGHITLSYFGFPQAAFLSGGPTVSKYTAPEMLLADASDLGMADFWSLGAIALEMASGQSPIYNTDTATLCANILSQEIRARKGVLDPDGRDLIKRLLNRDLKHRLGALHDCGKLMDHAFFRGVDWEQMRRRAMTPPFKPVNVPATTGATPRPSDEICGSDLNRFVSPPR